MMLKNPQPKLSVPKILKAAEKQLLQIASPSTEATALDASDRALCAITSRDGLMMAVRLCQLNLSLTEQVLGLVRNAANQLSITSDAATDQEIQIPHELETIIFEAADLRRIAVADIWRMSSQLNKLAKQFRARDRQPGEGFPGEALAANMPSASSSHSDIGTLLANVVQQFDHRPH